MALEGLLLTVFGFFVGCVLGSFSKALADRSLKRKSFSGRSYCSFCKNQLRWYDLFPILSYILLKGRCRFCHKKFGSEYIFVEIITGVLVAYLFWQAQYPSKVFEDIFQKIIFFADLAFKTFLISVLVSITITDLKKTLIPDRIMFPSIVIALSYLVVSTVFKISYLYYYLSKNEIGRYLLPPHTDYFRNHVMLTAEPLIWSILCAVLISGFFLFLIIITKGRGMGGGDVKLGFFMGLGLGFPGGVLATVLGFVTGAIVSVFLIIAGKKKFGQNIPFGPFLVIGSLITLYWGDQIIEWYLHLS